MKRAKQKDFFDQDRAYAPRRYTHGGTLALGKRKLKRPLDRRRPVHLVLKSSYAKGRLSFLSAKNKLTIEKIVTTRAKQFGVTLHSKQNVGNHLHIVASFARAKGFQDFLRTIAALIARHVTGARRGKPFGKRFWDHLAFTRVIMGRRDFRGVKGYVEMNRIEAEYGKLARDFIEEFLEAEAKAQRSGRSVWEILETG